MSEQTQGNSEARGQVLADSECAGALQRSLGMLKQMREDAGGCGSTEADATGLGKWWGNSRGCLDKRRMV